MGTDPAAVVDPQLRVRGITGLRVADASVMPVIPNAHPSATVLAIAERAAALVDAKVAGEENATAQVAGNSDPSPAPVRGWRRTTR